YLSSYCHHYHPTLPSFPTRRSSDLLLPARPRGSLRARPGRLMTSTATTWIDLDGVVNMRDVGGIPTTDGGAIRRGALLRSDNLQDLTPRDVAALRERGLTDVVDLRRDRKSTRLNSSHVKISYAAPC